MCVLHMGYHLPGNAVDVCFGSKAPIERGYGVVLCSPRSQLHCTLFVWILVNCTSLIFGALANVADTSLLLCQGLGLDATPPLS